MSLRLRRPDRDDLDSFVDWIGDPAFQALFYVGDDRVSQQIGQQLLGMVNGGMAAGLAPSGQFVLEGAQGSVGMATVQELSWRNRSCVADVYLIEPARDAQNAADAYRALVAYCFDEMNLHRVSFRIPPDATELHAALTRMGARKEVVLRGHVMRGGEPKDLYEFGVLRSEFAPRATQGTH